MADPRHVSDIIKFVGSRSILFGLEFQEIIEFIVDNSILLLDPIVLGQRLADEAEITKQVRIVRLEEELVRLKGPP